MNNIFASLMLLGALGSSDGYLPYWMTANRYGLMPERNGGLALVSVGSQADDSRTFQLYWGASLAVNAYDNPLTRTPLGSTSAPVTDNVSALPYGLQSGRLFNLFPDELFVSFRWKALTLDLGQKHRPNDFTGASPSLGSLSVTGGHLVETGNARPLPGYLLQLAPVPLPWTGQRAFIYGAYGDFVTTDNRYVRNALVHRMRLGFKAKAFGHLILDLGLDHYAMWGGVHPDPEVIQVKVTPENYLRLVLGMSAGADGNFSDRINVIGDQGGSEFFRASWQGDGWSITAQHEIPYNDASGMKFYNFPDGVNTIHFAWDDNSRWLSDIVYEHQYTVYQSGPINGEDFDEDGTVLTPPGVSTKGGDNYFSNGYYRSCWTHHGRIIGDPLILPSGTRSGSWSSALVNQGIENSRLKSHHLGLGGKLFRCHPYRLMLTYSMNYGTYKVPYKGPCAWMKPWGSVREEGIYQFSGAFTGEVRLPFRAGNKASTDRKKAPLWNAGTGLELLYGLYLDTGEIYDDALGMTLGLKLNLK